MKNILIASALATLFLVACEEDDTSIDAKNIYQGYELEYNAQENETVARAFFKKKDKTGEFIALDGGAQVRVNDTLLRRDAQSMAAYYTKFNGFVDTNYYEYASKTGNIYTNEFHLSNVNEISFSSDTGPFNMMSDYNVVWNGPPVAENEAVILQIGYEGGSIINKTVNETGSTKVQLEDKDLMEVGRGEAQMAIYRIKEQQLENTNEAGGRMQLIYSSGLVPVTIE